LRKEKLMTIANDHRPTMHPLAHASKSARIASILAVSALALGLTACGKNEDKTAAQRLDSAVERTEQAAADARAKTEAAMERARVEADKGSERAQAAAQDFGQTAKQAASSAMEKVDDATITAQVSAGLAKDPDLSAVKINVDTQNGAVTLNGPAPNLAAKDRAQTIAKSIKGVTSVTNLLVIAAG
jgi:hyperosmotically inducible periplasmic protein